MNANAASKDDIAVLYHVIKIGRGLAPFSGNMEAILSDIVAPEDLLVSFLLLTFLQQKT